MKVTILSMPLAIALVIDATRWCSRVLQLDSVDNVRSCFLSLIRDRGRAAEPDHDVVPRRKRASFGAHD